MTYSYNIYQVTAIWSFTSGLGTGHAISHAVATFLLCWLDSILGHITWDFSWTDITETDSSSQHFSFPCQNHSTIAPHSFIHLPPTLYNVFLPVFQFSPVSIIPPLLNPHSFISPTLYNVFLPALQFSEGSAAILTASNHTWLSVSQWPLWLSTDVH